jgi:glyoxylase-like metal-dependent hydrolase (beta-lactamase superfamily II)
MIPFVREMTFEYGRSDAVSPLIRRVVANNPGPFTYLGTGTYIVGHGEVAVIDPGPILDDHLDAILAATAGERISHILITHTHLDHAPLAQPLQKRTGAVIYGLDEPASQADEGEDDHSPASHDTSRFRPDVAIADGQIVCGPGWSLEAVFTPGHASNHVAYALSEENALFCGDHIMGWSTTVISPPDGDMSQYYASLDRVQARAFDVLWPTHGPPITEVAPFIEAYRNHRLARERQILSELSHGPTTIADMIPRLYRGVDKRLHVAAARSVLAHLIHLVRTGQVHCEGAANLSSHFSMISNSTIGPKP